MRRDAVSASGCEFWVGISGVGSQFRDSCFRFRISGFGQRAPGFGCRVLISNNVLINFRKSTPPQKRQLVVLISNGKQLVDDFVGKLTFKNCSINTFCETTFR